MAAAASDEKGVIAACPHCGRKNRIPYAHLGEAGACGNCRTPLPALSTPVDVVSEAGFLRLIEMSPLPVLVDYWAPWCGPCRVVAPEMDKVAAANAGRLIVAKVDTEALPSLGQRYQIQAIPTMAVFAQGREAARASGARPASAIEALVRDALHA